jgi:hypothetical protein
MLTLRHFTKDSVLLFSRKQKLYMSKQNEKLGCKAQVGFDSSTYRLTDRQLYFALSVAGLAGRKKPGVNRLEPSDRKLRPS